MDLKADIVWEGIKIPKFNVKGTHLLGCHLANIKRHIINTLMDKKNRITWEKYLIDPKEVKKRDRKEDKASGTNKKQWKDSFKPDASIITLFINGSNALI